MRIESWNPNKFDETFENIAMDILVRAGEIIAEKAKKHINPKLNLSRPVYKKGNYRDLPWTSRDAGRLKRSIRVVRKKIKGGKAFSRRRNVRVIAGHYTAYYPYWVEFGSSTIKRKHGEKKETAMGKRKKKPTARDIEFGSSTIPPAPFMRTAFNESLSEIEALIGGARITGTFT